MQPTRYRIVQSDLHAHLVKVACMVDDPRPSGLRFRLPAWIPGGDLIRAFARHVASIRDELMTFGVVLEDAPADTAQLAFADEPPNILAARTTWLGA